VLRKLRSKHPDILCLQEIVAKRIATLKNWNFHVGQAEDYRHINGSSSYIATAMIDKKSVISFEKIKYAERHHQSWTSRWVYEKIAKLYERYDAVVATFRWKGKVYRVVNAHLSIACRPQERVVQLETLLKRYADGRTVFCGDFNVINDMLFRLFFSWSFGYRLLDYFYDERKAINNLINQFELNNIFARKKTIRWPFRQQFDHILTPKSWKIIRKRMVRLPLSDHKALLAVVSPE